ncbi:glycosyltransferase family 4 protein [candidate division KSB1 bacterium]|nr:glycosyltransferase family 4 protein [candidate division KSB1 bacterium]
MDKSILIIGNFLSATRGVRSICEDLSEQLALHGWSVVKTSCKSARIPRLSDMLYTVWAKRREYVIAHVDVFSGKAFYLSQIVCFFLRLLRKPFVLSLHGGGLPQFARRHPARVKRLFAAATAITAPSSYLTEKMKPFCDDIRLIPNPINLDLYEYKVRRKSSPCLVWLRSFHTIYNPLLAPKVIALLAKRFPDIHLTMIGPDKGDGSKKRTRELSVQLGVHHHLTIAERIAKLDISKNLNAADIFINTTSIDNTPVTVLEAMACGLCIVSTNVGGIPYLLHHQEDSLLVPPDDPQAMADAIERLLRDDQLAEKLSRNARQQVEKFAWPRVMCQWESLLCTVAGGKWA